MFVIHRHAKKKHFIKCSSVGMRKLIVKLEMRWEFRKKGNVDQAPRISYPGYVSMYVSGALMHAPIFYA